MEGGGRGGERRVERDGGGWKEEGGRMDKASKGEREDKRRKAKSNTSEGRGRRKERSYQRTYHQS